MNTDTLDNALSLHQLKPGQRVVLLQTVILMDDKGQHEWISTHTGTIQKLDNRCIKFKFPNKEQDAEPELSIHRFQFPDDPSTSHCKLHIIDADRMELDVAVAQSASVFDNGAFNKPVFEMPKFR